MFSFSSFSSCEDFILFCSYHNKFFVSPFITGANHTSCCQDLFGGQRPTFSSAGTCYTTNTLVTEDLPSTYSSLEIYADVRTEITPSKYIEATHINFISLIFVPIYHGRVSDTLVQYQGLYQRRHPMGLELCMGPPTSSNGSRATEGSRINNDHSGASENRGNIVCT